MGCYDRIKAHLQSTRLYDMSKDSSLVQAEMKAYADVLDDMFYNINELCRTCFFDELINPMHSYFERLFGFSGTNIQDLTALTENEELILQTKIDCMKKRLKINNTSFKESDIIDAIASGGMTAQITHAVGSKNIIINIVEDSEVFSSESVKRNFIEGFIPPCYTCQINFLT